MKHLILSLIVVLASSISFAYEVSPKITSEDSQVIVNYLNDICGDTWCEGEYDLKFFNVASMQQNDEVKYFLNFSAANSYEQNSLQQFLACEIQSPEIIEPVLSDLRSLKYASEVVMAFDNQIDNCLQQLLNSQK